MKELFTYDECVLHYHRPDFILSCSAPALLADPPSAVGTMTGFISGVGSLGPILQSSVTSYIVSTYGWRTLFALFIVCVAVAIVCMMDAALAMEFKIRNPRLRRAFVLSVVVGLTLVSPQMLRTAWNDGIVLPPAGAGG